jgi:hypothetical protein
VRVASLCSYRQKRKTRRQKQSDDDFANFSFHMIRRCADDDCFHSDFPLYLVFVFPSGEYLLLAISSRKFGTEFPKIFEATDFF